MALRIPYDHEDGSLMYSRAKVCPTARICAVPLLGVLLLASDGLADAPHGTYTLTEKTPGTVKGVRVRVACGDSANRYISAITQLDIFYDGTARVNSRAWKVLGFSADGIKLQDPETPKNVVVTLVLWRDNATAHSVLEYLKLTDEGVEYCRTLQGLRGHYSK
jgi:hypothetical protein